jgi:hypothetical protein
MGETPTLIRSLDPPLRLYFRPGSRDHRAFERSLMAGMPPFSGAVLDASRVKSHAELRAELRSRGLESVLDPMALELATEGGWAREGLRSLTWAGREQHRPENMSRDSARRLANDLVEFATKHGYSSIVAPTHYLQDGIRDPWWQKDRMLVAQLLDVLRTIDSRSRPRLYYRLATSRKVLADVEQRQEVIRVLADLSIDAVWVCVHPSGAASGPTVVRSYYSACLDLDRLSVPIVAERSGGLGMAMMAFDVVGGMECGITSGENFDANRLLRAPRPREEGKAFAMGWRVYLDRLGIFLSRKEAEVFFARHGMKSRFGCQGRVCCREIGHMLQDPLRHFLVTRAQEVADLAQVPRHNRATVYMEKTLRRASDDAILVAKADPKKFGEVERRLRGWRLVLGATLEERQRDRNEARLAQVIPLRGR